MVRERCCHWPEQHPQGLSPAEGGANRHAFSIFGEEKKEMDSFHPGRALNIHYLRYLLAAAHAVHLKYTIFSRLIDSFLNADFRLPSLFLPSVLSFEWMRPQIRLQDCFSCFTSHSYYS
jgi:hypothetical protein